MAMKVCYTVMDGEIISEERGGVESFYVPDALGSTIAIEDSSGTVTDQIAFWPYGSAASRTGIAQTPFLYVGDSGYYSDNSGKAYVRARYLGEDLGRWLTSDPMGFESGAWNLYAYVGGNPISYSDPSGLAAKWTSPQFPGPYPRKGGGQYRQCSGTNRASCISKCKSSGGVMWCTDTFDANGRLIGTGCACKNTGGGGSTGSGGGGTPFGGSDFDIKISPMLQITPPPFNPPPDLLLDLCNKIPDPWLRDLCRKLIGH